MAETVIVYSTPFCAPCEKLKRYLKAQDVEFSVVDLMMDEEAADLMAGKKTLQRPRAASRRAVSGRPKPGPGKDRRGAGNLDLN